MVDHHQVGMGTLWIKLNISENEHVLEEDQKQDQDDVVLELGVKDEDEDIEVEIPTKNNDDRRRICHVCNKGFGSGKALGGHMRIHVQGSKKQLLLPVKKSKTLVDRCYKKRILQQRDEQQDEIDLENQLLPTCSICGKNFPSMKSLFGHMRCHPERAWRGIQPPNLKSRDEIDRKTASATTVTVPGWSVTAKRGRKPNAEEATISGSKDDEQLHDAVHHLMLLANGDSVESGLTGGSSSNSLTSKPENNEFPRHVTRKRKKKKLKFLDSVQDSSSPTSATAATPEKFKCNTCGKIFATHQALGGHKSSHNKFRMVIQNSDVTSEEAAASSSKLPGEFISHTTTGGRRILDFDLNELPPDHEDELSGNNHEYFPFFTI